MTKVSLAYVGRCWACLYVNVPVGSRLVLSFWFGFRYWLSPVLSEPDPGGRRRRRCFRRCLHCLRLVSVVSVLLLLASVVAYVLVCLHPSYVCSNKELCRRWLVNLYLHGGCWLKCICMVGMFRVFRYVLPRSLRSPRGGAASWG